METAEWIAQIRQGDLDAFNRLVGDYQDQVYRLAFYLISNEKAATTLAESVFQRAYREARSYRGEPARNWLYSLVARSFLHEIAARKVGRTLPLSAQKSNDPHAQFVQKVLSILPPEQRLALALVDVEGLDYHQAASIAGWPVSTISSKLAQARESFSRLTSQQPTSA